ncbi:Hint domain-containing protein [Shimia haliotis]|uniref:Hint domain-containing protein n=2 Tax=Shimia haliotis TaxID=1280847 RepID=A0A1I4GZA1_9RHOB|nr:Hint domain-containing protein [Shimia haliotis]
MRLGKTMKDTSENWWTDIAPQKGKVAPVYSGPGFGLLADTPVATPDGWVAVGELDAGDEVLTFDAGFQPLSAMVREDRVRAGTRWPETLRPVLVPAGALENREEVLMLPHQGILLEVEEVADRLGDPYAVIPAAALACIPGVERVSPQGAAEIVLPVFAEDHMVFAAGGMLTFCQAHWGTRAGLMPRFGAPTNYNMLPVNAARALVEVLLTEFEGEAIA